MRAPELEELRPDGRVRTDRLRTRRRTRLRRQLGGVALTSLVLAAALVAAVLVQRGRQASRDGDAPQPGAPVAQETWLLVGTLERDPTGRADWLAVASHDRTQDRSVIVYVPRTTLTEIPGQGMDTLAAAQATGREPLVRAALSNLLGIRIDHTLRLSDQGARALFAKLGPVTIDVERALERPSADGTVVAVFAPGTQKLDGKRASEWLAFAEDGGDEISRSVRHAALWSALLRQHGGDRAERFAATMAESSALFVTDGSRADVERFFGEFASVPSDRLFFETLPVHATGVDTGTAMYAPDAEAVASVVERHFAGARIRAGGTEGRLVQVLNGNGVPGIGQSVADLLVPRGFRIVLNQNARRFDYDTTQIVIYEATSEARAVADEVRSALGTGNVVVSRQNQSLVDVTIVVGHDFVPPREGGR